MYIGVFDYSSFMQISTFVIAHVNLFSSSVDHSRGNMIENTLIVTVDWQRW